MQLCLYITSKYAFSTFFDQKSWKKEEKGTIKSKKFEVKFGKKMSLKFAPECWSMVLFALKTCFQ